jgi:protein-S-isoprenylcysteine O-methyltransferase Ste14
MPYSGEIARAGWLCIRPLGPAPIASSSRGREGEEMRKIIAAVVGVLLLLAGAGVAIAHYVIESSFTSQYITLAIAAALFVAGWALLDWGAEVTRRWEGDKPKGSGPKYPS